MNSPSSAEPDRGRLFILAWLTALTISAESLRAGAPVRGANVSLGKNPGGSVGARTTTDAKGAFSFHDVAPGSYTLTLSPCTSVSPASTTQSNPIVRFVLDNPGLKQATINISDATCALSDTLPLIGKRMQNGTVALTGTLPLEVLAAGVTIDVQIGTTETLSGTISADP
jgi:hypothetical protein